MQEFTCPVRVRARLKLQRLIRRAGIYLPCARPEAGRGAPACNIRPCARAGADHPRITISISTILCLCVTVRAMLPIKKLKVDSVPCPCPICGGAKVSKYVRVQHMRRYVRRGDQKKLSGETSTAATPGAAQAAASDELVSLLFAQTRQQRAFT